MNLLERLARCLAAISVAAVFCASVTSCAKKEEPKEPEVISKRVKIGGPESAPPSPTAEVHEAAPNADGHVAKHEEKAAAPEPIAELQRPLEEKIARKEPLKEAQKEAPEEAPSRKEPKKTAKPVEEKSDLKERKAAENGKKKAEKAARNGEEPGVKKDAKKKASKDRAAEAQARPWVIHLGSYRTLAEAQGIAARIKGAGYGAYITEFTKGPEKWHRVRVGFFKTKEDASSAVSKIEKGSKVKIKDPWILKPEKEETVRHMDIG